MPIYHIVLFKLKPDADPVRVKRWQDVAEAMVGKVPGLISLHAGPPLEGMAERAKGFNMGVVIVVESIEALGAMFKHPSHDELHVLHKEVCEEGSGVGYDIQF
ncbi:hypothetical protein BJY04DRAFT_222655 [Aspergillus karnatakaensis]|uniref:Dabb family protein n=1 Tax=Aspergillus karnatakaensis TaxID=1810916 RepID=UPI003CCD6003